MGVTCALRKRGNFMMTVIVIVGAALAFITWGVTRKSRLGHWMRVVVMFFSGGFIFPHVLTENEDIGNNPIDKRANDSSLPKSG